MCPHILIVDGAVQVIKQYVVIIAYGFTLTAEAVGWTPNSFSFSLPSLLLFHALQLQVVFTPFSIFLPLLQNGKHSVGHPYRTINTQYLRFFSNKSQVLKLFQYFCCSVLFTNY